MALCRVPRAERRAHPGYNTSTTRKSSGIWSFEFPGRTHAVACGSSDALQERVPCS